MGWPNCFFCSDSGGWKTTIYTSSPRVTVTNADTDPGEPTMSDHDHSPDIPKRAQHVEIVDGENWTLRIYPQHDDFEPFEWNAAEFVGFFPDVQEVFEDVEIKRGGRILQWPTDFEPFQYVHRLYKQVHGLDASYYPEGVPEPSGDRKKVTQIYPFADESD
jgi:hypothetical protein